MVVAGRAYGCADLLAFECGDAGHAGRWVSNETNVRVVKPFHHEDFNGQAIGIAGDTGKLTHPAHVNLIGGKRWKHGRARWKWNQLDVKFLFFKQTRVDGIGQQNVYLRRLETNSQWLLLR